MQGGRDKGTKKEEGRGGAGGGEEQKNEESWEDKAEDAIGSPAAFQVHIYSACAQRIQ